MRLTGENSTNMEKDSFWCHIGQHKSNMDSNQFYSCSRIVTTKETKRQIKNYG